MDPEIDKLRSEARLILGTIFRQSTRVSQNVASKVVKIILSSKSHNQLYCIIDELSDILLGIDAGEILKIDGGNISDTDAYLNSLILGHSLHS